VIMGKWSTGQVNWTPTATADTTALATNTYAALGGGTSTQRLECIEFYIAGVAGASSPTFLMFARDSTVGTSVTALAAPAFQGPLDAVGQALVATPSSFVSAGGPPQRSAVTTLARLNLALNAFGGIVRWVAAPGEEFSIVGNTASLGEASLSAFTGGTVGLINHHIIYEV